MRGQMPVNSSDLYPQKKKRTVWLLSHLLPYVSLLLCGTDGSSRMVNRM